MGQHPIFLTLKASIPGMTFSVASISHPALFGEDFLDIQVHC
jgi:hypothetical protein